MSPSGCYSNKWNISTVLMICPIQTDLKKAIRFIVGPYTFSECLCFQMLENKCSVAKISWGQLDLVVDNKIIVNEHSVNGDLRDWQGTVYWIHSASESSSSYAILYACTLLHWLNWHDPHALEQSSPCFLHRSVRHAVVHWQRVILRRFRGYGSCYVITGNRMFFVSAKRQPQSVSSIASSFLIHVMT